MATAPNSRIFEVGNRFGRVTLIERPIFKPAPGKVRARCDCGDVRYYWTTNLRTQIEPMCPTCRTATRASKGEHKHPLFVIWKGIIQRCENPKHTHYDKYGARGIRMCSRWREDFRTFAADMGERPSLAHTVDRIDPNGCYEPGNVRWAVPTEQSNNRRNNRVIEFNGEALTQEQWARRIGLTGTGLAHRLQKGWSVQRALTTPPRSRPE